MKQPTYSAEGIKIGEFASPSRNLIKSAACNEKKRNKKSHPQFGITPLRGLGGLIIDQLARFFDL